MENLLTKKQLAQKRNYFKFILAGMTKPFDSRILSEEEKLDWNRILMFRDELIKNFDDTSREMGLNVLRKCWCGKSVYKDNSTCKRHIEDD